MIVPRNSLILLAALVLLPCAAAHWLNPALMPIVLTALAGLLAVSILDAASVYGSLDGIRAEFPKVVRLTKDRDGVIDLYLSADHAKGRRLRVALDDPAAFRPRQETIVAEFPHAAERIHLQWPCLPLRRGIYHVQNVYLDGRSPLGLWSLYGSVQAETVVRVYPNLQAERKHVAALFLNRGSFGIHAQRQLGKGREFEKLREYVQGDSYEDIHWKATARRAQPITKEYQIERTQEVYVVIDASRLSGRSVPAIDGEARTIQLERFISSALILGVAAERQGDHFGLLTFSDGIDRFVRAKGGKPHFGACREALHTLQPKVVNPDFAEMAAFIRRNLRKRALLVFLTNLDDPILAESFRDSISLLSRHHLVLVNMLKPEGVQPLFSGGEVTDSEDLYTHLAGHIQWRRLVELGQVLHHRNVTLSLLDHSQMTVQLVNQYVNLKQRQLL